MERRWGWVTASVVLAACNGAVESDYTLKLIPHVPANQDLFSDDPPLKIGIRNEQGIWEWTALGQAGSNQIEQKHAPPLTDAMVGFVVETSAGPEDALDAALLRAYGETGPFSLNIGKDDVEANMLVSEFGGIGDLGVLDDGAMFASAALLDNGEVLVFGGSSSLVSLSKTTDAILRLESLDSGDWSFDQIGTMPSKLLGTSATVVHDGDGNELVLVAGGRPTPGGEADNTDAAFLFDPVDETIIWNGSVHYASSKSLDVLTPNGKLLRLGGVYEEGLYYTPPKFEIFDPDSRTAENGPGADLSVGCGAPSGAPYGTDSALVCGGGNLQEGGTEFAALAGCSEINSNGDVDTDGPIPDMPIPLLAHAMTLLNTGEVMVTGGVTGEVGAYDTGPAQDGAWIFDGEDWREVTPMNHARANHKLVAVPDGRVIAIGGQSEGGVNPEINAGAGGSSVNCSETWDPATDTWNDADACGDAGAGVFSTIAVNPLHGAFVLEGFGGGDGGRAFGIVSTGPI